MLLKWVLPAVLCVGVGAAPPLAKNVVLIGVDDLRPDISGPYGQTQVLTPNLDRLAASGTTFLRAYCQVALCSPSRTSLLTGLRPDISRVWQIGPYFRQTMGKLAGDAVVTLPQHFRLNGFYTTGAGKIFHPGSSSGGPSHGEGGGDGGYPFNASGSWSKPYFFCDQFYNGTLQSPVAQAWPNAAEENAGCIQSAECISCLDKAGSLGGKHAWKGAPCNASCYPDGAVADEAVRQIRLNAKTSTLTPDHRFFLAVGFKRPHLGWMAPDQYFNMYNVSDVAIAKHRAPPTGMPIPAWSGNGELCNMDDVTCTKANGYTGIVPDDKHAELRRAYYGVVTFMDSQLGRVLDALDETGLRSSTAIVFWGDHGYQLGEHGIWCKITNFELATRVPLIISIPGQPNPGGASMALVEHLDIYPTLADVAGIAIPAATMGRSMVPLVETPSAWSAADGVFNASYSQILRNDGIMGYTMRTDQWRVTRWGKFNAVTGRPDFDAPPIGVELYSHATDTEADFDAFENVNLAATSEHNSTVAELLYLLETNWDNGKLPPVGPAPAPPAPPSPAPAGQRFELVVDTAVLNSSDDGGVGVGRGSVGSSDAPMCMSTDGATGVIITNCGSSVATAEWVQINNSKGKAEETKEEAPFASTSASAIVGDASGNSGGIEFANAAEGKMCLNLYGGIPVGCAAGANIHLAPCSTHRAGNIFAYNAATSQIEAAGCTNSLCISVTAAEVGGGTVDVAPCAKATKWSMQNI